MLQDGSGPGFTLLDIRATVGLGELAKRIIDGNATISLSDLIASYEKFTPGASWNCGYYVDLNTGIERKTICWYIKIPTSSEKVILK